MYAKKLHTLMKKVYIYLKIDIILFLLIIQLKKIYLVLLKISCQNMN